MISGYAAVFYDGSSDTEYDLGFNMVERIMPGAFDAAIKRGDDAFGLFNHDPNNILGRLSADTLKLSIDKKGLRYEIDRSETQLYRDVEIWQDRGELTGGSFGFQVESERFVEKDDLTIREIESVKLYDVGPVTYPAYSGTEGGRSLRLVDREGRAIVPEAGVDEVRSAIRSYRGRCNAVRVRARLVKVLSTIRR